MTLNDGGTGEGGGSSSFPPGGGGGGGHYPPGEGTPSGAPDDPLHVQAHITPPRGMEIPSSIETIERAGGLSASALRLAVICMSVVLVCIAVVTFVVVLNAQADQHNADALTEANEELRNEVRCRAVPSLAYDQAFSDLQVGIAEALVALGNDEAIEAILDELPLTIEAVRVALEAREASLGACVAGD